AGNITQDGSGLLIGGVSNFNAGGVGAINLYSTSNDFTGNVIASNTGNNGIRITNSETAGKTLKVSNIAGAGGEVRLTGANITAAGSVDAGQLYVTTPGKFTNQSTITSIGVTIEAGDMALGVTGTAINATGSGRTTITAASGASIDLGSSGSASDGVLKLSAAELNTLTGQELEIRGSSLGGDMVVSAPVAFSNFGSYVNVVSGGDLTVNTGANITSSVALKMYARQSVGKLTNKANINAPSLVLDAAKMAIGEGTITSSGTVQLGATNNENRGVILGGPATDLTEQLELSAAEIDTVTASILKLGNLGYDSEMVAYYGSGPLRVSGPITAAHASSLVLQANGDITLGGIVNVGGRQITVDTVGAILQDTGGKLQAGVLNLSSKGGIGTNSLYLETMAANIMANNGKAPGSTGPIKISNNDGVPAAALSIGAVTQGAGNSDAISIKNKGATTVTGAVYSAAGPITILAQSPLTVAGGGSVTTGSGNISLEAGSSGSPTDDLLILGNVVTTSGAINLKAGDAITVSGTIAGATPVQVQNTNNTAIPTLLQCIANPTLAGCTSVLPTLSACLGNAALSGCSVVLPSISTCTAAPSTSGCSVVLPALAVCVAAPSTAGCSAVLPTISACVSAPSTTGCSAVLPSATVCAAAPSTAGCSAVLPTIAACIAAPATAGCAAVLPTLSVCIGAPATAGCSVVLPSVAACVAAPGTAGCSAVLPSLATCLAAPSTPNCSAVLPSVAACTATPTLAGCSAVLPGLGSCIADPTQNGCAAVLPTVAQCTSNSALAGCGAVLPSIAVCATSPSTPGCSAVLPTLALCTSAPATAGCAAILPSLAA
ncbi:MAG TPA: hypothetical protein VIT92_00005, partial [Burkholderiaceae bacterium]